MSGLLLRYILSAVGGIGVILGLWAWVTTGAYNRGRASVETELRQAREHFQKEKEDFNARLNRIAGSIRRRCAAGERLPECTDLER